MMNGVVVMDLSKALNSINFEKTNIMRNSENGEQAEKDYPQFPISRLLSYSQDCIFIINELNCRGLSQHGITPLMHYEFLLNLVPKKKRFNKWIHPEKDKMIEMIMEYENISYQKASEINELLPQSDKDKIKAIFKTRVQ